MEITSGDLTPRATRPLRRRLVRTSLGVGPARPDADASDERIIELWLRDRPANKKNGIWSAICHHRVLRNASTHSNPTDFVSANFREPNSPIRTGGNMIWSAICRRNRIFRNTPADCDSSDFATIAQIRKPYGSVRTSGNTPRITSCK
jgi:hypothetical protein